MIILFYNYYWKGIVTIFTYSIEEKKQNLKVFEKNNPSMYKVQTENVES